MNELNKQISDIFRQHEESPAVMTQQLFNLLGSRSPEQTKFVQTAILYSLEKIHEWDNLLYYIHKWNAFDFRHSLIIRMRQRIEEPAPTQSVLDQSYQLKRLIEKYVQLGSPKRKENSYKEPINNQFRKEQISIHKDQSQKSKIYENQRINRTQELASEAQQAYNGAQKLKLQNLTGRPPILKKSSLANQKIKKQVSSSQDQLSNNISQQAGSKTSKINLMQLKERLSLKINRSQDPNPNRSDAAKGNKQMTNQKDLKNAQTAQPQIQKQISNRSEASQLPKQKEKYNQSFPQFEQFNFGSNKKQRQQQLPPLQIKPVTKMPLERKVRRIPKNSNEEISKEIINKSEQFSFMDDGFEEDPSVWHFSQIKKQQFPKQSMTSSKKAPIFGRSTLQQIQTFNPQKSNKKDVYQNASRFEHDTPYFADQKGHSNQFLTKQEMSVVQQVQCLYLFNNLLKQKKIDVQSIFDEAIAQEMKRR